MPVSPRSSLLRTVRLIKLRSVPFSKPPYCMPRKASVHPDMFAGVDSVRTTVRLLHDLNFRPTSPPDHRVSTRERVGKHVLSSETGFHTERHCLPASTLHHPGRRDGRLGLNHPPPGPCTGDQSLMPCNRASADRSALHEAVPPCKSPSARLASGAFFFFFF